MGRHNVGSVDEVPPRRSLEATVDGLEIAVFNLDGEFYAISNRCPHKNAPLSEATERRFNMDEYTKGELDVENCTVSCPWHSWTWDLKTGEFVVDRSQRLRTFPVSVEGGDIWVEV